MTPIEKNIIVVDENGKEYEATYPGRAKGLVKNGRARFVGENKICLVCPPPEKETEDMDMSENTQNVKLTDAALPQYTVEYILSRIEEVRKESKDFSEACLLKLDCEKDMSSPKISAISEILRIKEATNQQILKTYEKMYDNLERKPENNVQAAVLKIREIVEKGEDKELSRIAIEKITDIVEKELIFKDSVEEESDE